MTSLLVIIETKDDQLLNSPESLAVFESKQKYIVQESAPLCPYSVWENLLFSIPWGLTSGVDSKGDNSMWFFQSSHYFWTSICEWNSAHGHKSLTTCTGKLVLNDCDTYIGPYTEYTPLAIILIFLFLWSVNTQFCSPGTLENCPSLFAEWCTVASTPYLPFTGELWGIIRELFKEHWPWYLESAL